jgi:hypothetical protein
MFNRAALTTKKVSLIATNHPETLTVPLNQAETCTKELLYSVWKAADFRISGSRAAQQLPDYHQPLTKATIQKIAKSMSTTATIPTMAGWTIGSSDSCLYLYLKPENGDQLTSTTFLLTFACSS